jgi:multimeric flavodoxin WrbA
MKAVILLGTLKKNELSNTETLSQFLSEKLAEQKIDCKIIKLVDYNIYPGTYSNMGEGDEWTYILEYLLDSDIIIFATPIWWSNQSSEIQRVIERLDEIHDEILEGKKSRLEGKTGGIIITGDSDGAQNIIANISNFFNAIGITFPPFATLSVLWEKQKKGSTATREELLDKYKNDYSDTAVVMIKQLVEYRKMLKDK